MERVTRRTFVARIGAAAIVATVVRLARGAATLTGVSKPATLTSAYLFFTAEEAVFIEAACERLLIHDTGAANTVSLPVAGYLDRQLAGPWGAGRELYRSGPWQPGTSGSRICSNPAALFRNALRAINRHFGARRTTFEALDASAQRSFLRELAAGSSLLGDVPSMVFFELLLAMTVEGLFVETAQVQHGLIAWPLKAFPGAHFRLAGRGARYPIAMSQSQR